MTMDAGQWYIGMAAMPPPPMPQQWGQNVGNNFSNGFPKANNFNNYTKQQQAPHNKRQQQQQHQQQRPQRGAGGQVGARGKRNTPADGAVDVTPLYKTRLCNFHVYGACVKGTRCPFAHGEDDLWPSPDFEKTSACPTMLNEGVCDKPNCRYAHSAEELRSSPGLLKTKMCSFYLDGLCIVGEACRFAHSKEELREAVEVSQSVEKQEEVVQQMAPMRQLAAPPPMQRVTFPDNSRQTAKSKGEGQTSNNAVMTNYGYGMAEEVPVSWDFNINALPPRQMSAPAGPGVKAKPFSISDALPANDAFPINNALPFIDALPAKPPLEVDTSAIEPKEEVNKLAFSEEFSQVAAAMKKILVDDDDTDAFADFNKKASLFALPDSVDSAERSTDQSSNASGSASDQLSEFPHGFGGDFDGLKVTAKNTFLCVADLDETVVRRGRRSKSR